jgi:hypothetical protein
MEPGGPGVSFFFLETQTRGSVEFEDEMAMKR